MGQAVPLKSKSLNRSQPVRAKAKKASNKFTSRSSKTFKGPAAYRRAKTASKKLSTSNKWILFRTPPQKASVWKQTSWNKLNTLNRSTQRPKITLLLRSQTPRLTKNCLNKKTVSKNYKKASPNSSPHNHPPPPKINTPIYTTSSKYNSTNSSPTITSAPNSKDSQTSSQTTRTFPLIWEE